MQPNAFEQLITTHLKAIYPKALLKPASLLTPEEINIKGRFNNPTTYQKYIAKEQLSYYITVPAPKADSVLDALLANANNTYIAYTSRIKLQDKSPKDTYRVVLVNTIDSLDGLRREGCFNENKSISHEAIISFFEHLTKCYLLRFEDISSNTIAGTIQQELSTPDALDLASIIYSFNQATDLTIDTVIKQAKKQNDAPNNADYIQILAQKLLENKTFYFELI